MQQTLHKLAVPVLLACGIVATLAREIVFANYFGVSRELEVFRVAFSLPNMLSQSLAPAFIGALMPALVMVEKAGAGEYRDFCLRLVRVWAGAVVLLTLLGLLTAGLQAAWLAPGFDDAAHQRLQLSLAICWVFFLLTALSFFPRLLLNHRQVFWPGSSTSVVISITLIVASVGFYNATNADAERLLAMGAVIAGAIILLLHSIPERNWVRNLVASLRSMRWSMTTTGQAIIGPLLSVMSLHVVNALPRFVDRAVGSSLEQGAIASLDYSFNILTVPGILLGTSVITVYYPQFVRWVKDGRERSLDRDIVMVVSLTVVAAFLVGLGIYALATEIVSFIYGRGAFGETAVNMTATLLGWHGLGLGFMVAAMVLFQGCLAFGAFKALLVITVIRLGSKLLAIWWLIPQFGLDGLGASFIVPEAISTVLLAGVLFMLCRRDRTS